MSNINNVINKINNSDITNNIDNINILDINNEQNNELYTYEFNFWKDFFEKNQKNQNGSIEFMKHLKTLKLKNVNINNNILNGKIDFDIFNCPNFTNNFIIKRNNKKYIGCFENRQLTGYIQKNSIKFKYKGYMLKGNKKKKGKLIFDKKIIYNGYWKNDKRNGYGILKLINEKKIIYKGLWINNKRNFYGEQLYKNNCIYKGFWKNNIKCGLGKMIWYTYINKKNKNIKYAKIEKEKNFCDKLKLNDVKKYFFSNSLEIHIKKKKKNDKLEKNDEKENILNDKLENEKKKKNSDNLKKNNEKENILNDKLEENKNNYDKVKTVEHIYKGEWKNDLKNGFGIYIWFQKKKKKNIYEENYKYLGYWKKGKKHGYGIFYYNRYKYIGYWIKNKKDGFGYLIENNQISLCLYKKNELVSIKKLDFNIEKSNYIHKNEAYRNFLYNVINLICFKNMYNLKKTNINFFYKILYENLEMLINIYNFYKKSKRYFRLYNLWKILCDINIININFHFDILSELIIDEFFLFNEEKLLKLFEKNCPEKFLFNENDLIDNFFNFNNRYMNIFCKNIRENNIYDKENTKIENDLTINLENNYLIKNNHSIINNENNKLNESYINKNLKCIFNLMKNLLFNINLLFSNKNSINFYKYHCIYSCHQKENNFIFKKIFISILNKKEGNYLHYVLISVLQSFPFIYFKFYFYNEINKNMFHFNLEKKKKQNFVLFQRNMKRNNNKINYINLFDVLKNPKQIIYLKKLIMFIHLNRNYINDENKNISFVSFIYTLIHLSIYMSIKKYNNLKNVNNIFKTLINKIKNIKKKDYYLKKKNKNNNNNFMSLLKAIKKYEYYKLHKTKNNENNNNKIKKYIICSICNNYIYKNLKKTKINKCNFNSFLKRIYFKDKIFDKELIIILKNFIYYFMFYFSLYELKENKISIFNMKLKFRLKLKDILLFLQKIKLFKKNVFFNKTKIINVCSFSIYNQKKLIKQKTILINDCKNDNLNEKENKKENDINKNYKNKEIIKKKNNEKKTTNKKQKDNKENIKINKLEENKIKENFNETKYENKDNQKINNEIFFKQKKKKNNYIKRFSKKICLPLYEILLIFAKVLNIHNLYLVNKPYFYLNISQIKKKKLNRINKHILKNNLFYYLNLLKKHKKTKNYFNNYISLKKEINNLNENKNINEIKTYSKKDKHIDNKSKNVQNIDKDNLSNKEEEKKKKKKKEKLNVQNNLKKKEENMKEINNDDNLLLEKNNLNELNNIEKIYYIKKRNNKYKILKKCFYKQYISIYDFFNINITSFELFLFFINFLKRVKKKNKMKICFNDLLYFFIFHILLYKTSLLAYKLK